MAPVSLAEAEPLSGAAVSLVIAPETLSAPVVGSVRLLFSKVMCLSALLGGAIGSIGKSSSV